MKKQRLLSRIKKTYLAFTLSEVLITILTIGIVAAMTLPTVIDNSRNKQLETALKRSYSVLSQALDMHYAKEGIRVTPQNCKFHELKPILMKYLNVTKDCGFGATDAANSCIPHPNYATEEQEKKGYVKYKNLNGTSDITMNYFDDGQFILNDGTHVLLENAGGVLLFISVDVNGYKKGPNRLGIDLFTFDITPDGTLLPMGAKGTHNTVMSLYCTMTSNNGMNGAGCTHKALTEKDYFKNLPR